jgi:hypothetical protein
LENYIKIASNSEAKISPDNSLPRPVSLNNIYMEMLKSCGATGFLDLDAKPPEPTTEPTESDSTSSNNPTSSNNNNPTSNASPIETSTISISSEATSPRRLLEQRSEGDDLDVIDDSTEEISVPIAIYTTAIRQKLKRALQEANPGSEPTSIKLILQLFPEPVFKKLFRDNPLKIEAEEALRSIISPRGEANHRLCIDSVSLSDMDKMKRIFGSPLVTHYHESLVEIGKPCFKGEIIKISYNSKRCTLLMEFSLGLKK